MAVYNQVLLGLPKMQGQKSLTLRRGSFLCWGREHVAFVFASKGGQYLICGGLQPIATQITQDARPKIIDTPLTLIVRMAQGACHYWFCLWWQPIPHLWMFANNHHLGYSRCKDKSCWSSIDIHFQNGAVTMLLSLWPVQAATTSVMHNSDHFAFQFPYSHSQQSFTLRWRSFQCVVHSKSATNDNCIHYDLKLLVALPADWHLAHWYSQHQQYCWTGWSHSIIIYTSCQMIYFPCYTSVY